MSEDVVKFAYVRDLSVPERVLTVARKIVGDHIHYGFCVNKVVVVDLNTLPKHYQKNIALNATGQMEVMSALADVSLFGSVVVSLDKFDRKKGKLIASGRMAKRPVVVPRVAGEAPYETVLKHISADTEHKTAANIAAEELVYLEFYRRDGDH